MLTVTPVRLCRRTRRALIAAALPAALAAVALPSAAHAGDAFVSQDGVLSYSDGSNKEDNDVLLRVEGNEIVITDSAAPVTSGSSACQVVSIHRVECPANLQVQVFTLGGSDKVEYRLPHEGVVDLGNGVDTVFGGRREGSAASIRPVSYHGGTGHDTISFAGADRGVSVTPEDNLANDGRPGDNENVGATFDTFTGSNFSDAPLFGTPANNVMVGLGGNDQIAGGAGFDVFVTQPGDGADDYHGGPDFDSIDYFHHSTPLNVSLDNVANDGDAGERDQVRSNVENIFGGSAGDTFTSFGAFSYLAGNGGRDTLIGGSGPDTLVGGAGRDTLDAGIGNDVVAARDGELDDVECGTGTDSATIDNGEGINRNCESLDFGTLRLTPGALRTAAGETARMKLSWRHPRAWKQLDKIELRLTRGGAIVGKITIRPRRDRVTADGAVRLVRRGARLAHKGKTVTARLALRLDGSLAGQTLKAEVEAVDTRGRRQLEPDAATVRVAK